ncbi:hypothetical protein, partial [Klebsiella pneumoniae]|uniref:hypothetical protein n=1 Tax=Klebsiella pneumoniae TaxID=573 RepID=UPI0013D8C1B1
ALDFLAALLLHFLLALLLPLALQRFLTAALHLFATLLVLTLLLDAPGHGVATALWLDRRALHLRLGKLGLGHRGHR